MLQANKKGAKPGNLRKNSFTQGKRASTLGTYRLSPNKTAFSNYLKDYNSAG
jgi:hypothetical protein